MADGQTPKPNGSAAPTVWVQGGSTSSKHDKWMAKRQAEAKARREAEDNKFAVARARPNEARIRQHKLGGRKEHPSVVLGLKHPKDQTVQDWMICELVMQPRPDNPDESELMLMMHCPGCIMTHGRPADDTVMHIRQSNRMFHVDQRKRDQRKLNPVLHMCAGEIWVSPEDKNEVVLVAGMVTTDDWCKCPLCKWEFKIDDSVVYTRN